MLVASFVVVAHVDRCCPIYLYLSLCQVRDVRLLVHVSASRVTRQQIVHKMATSTHVIVLRVKLSFALQ